MKTVYCVVLSVAIAVIGIAANSLRNERLLKSPDRVPFDTAIRERIYLSEKKLAAVIAEHQRATNDARRIWMGKRNEMATAYDEQIDALEQKVRDKEASNLRPPCLAAKTINDCVPGLYRFGGGVSCLLPNDRSIPYLKAIKVENDVCEISYSNSLTSAVKPNLMIRFYSSCGELICEAHNKWRFSSIAFGASCKEKEAVPARVMDACWVRFVNLRKGED